MRYYRKFVILPYTPVLNFTYSATSVLFCFGSELGTHYASNQRCHFWPNLARLSYFWPFFLNSADWKKSDQTSTKFTIEEELNRIKKREIWSGTGIKCYQELEASNTRAKELCEENPKSYNSLLRMDESNFQELLSLVTQIISIKLLSLLKHTICSGPL